LILWIPATRGLTARHLNELVDAHARLVGAMAAAEGACKSQGHAAPAARGPGPGGRVTFARCRGRAPRSAPPLGRREWVEIGRALVAVADSVVDLAAEVEGTRGGREPYRRFASAHRALRFARFRLDSLVHEQHPDWAAFTRVFYPGSRPLTNDDVSGGKPPEPPGRTGGAGYGVSGAEPLRGSGGGAPGEAAVEAFIRRGQAERN
jgi:hypothetical protein